jgi:RNA polymerase sigma factor (sigma-70 family)
MDDESPPASSFEALYLTHRGEAVRLAWLLTHDASLAEDIAQDAFVALYRAITRVADPAAYLRRSVINGVYERSRRREREQRRYGLVAATQQVVHEGPSGGISDALAALPIDQRTCIVLRYWADLRDHEIADAMGIRPGTARSHLSRATSRLRKELQ